MQIDGPNKRSDNNIRMLSGIVNVLIFLIIITPLCGFLFNCGCTWPWEGLAENCNYYDEHSEVRCPWCASTGAGAMSVGISIVSGSLAAMARLKPSIVPENLYGEMLVRMLIGMAVFLTATFGAGWISAAAQNYDYFIFTNR